MGVHLGVMICTGLSGMRRRGHLSERRIPSYGTELRGALCTTDFAPQPNFNSNGTSPGLSRRRAQTSRANLSTINTSGTRVDELQLVCLFSGRIIKLMQGLSTIPIPQITPLRLSQELGITQYPDKISRTRRGTTDKNL